MTKRSSFPALLLTGVLAGVLACSALALPAPALAVSDDPVLKRMDAVLEENARLREESWKLRKSPDREAARQVAESLAASEDRLERTRAEALAHVAGVSPTQVEALRKDGKSWGQASGELGVHPGFLGVGKTPMFEPRSARKAKPSAVAVHKSKRGKNKTTKAEAKATKPKAHTKNKVKQKKISR